MTVSDVDPWHMSLRRPFGRIVPTGETARAHRAADGDEDEVENQVTEKVVEAPKPKAPSRTTNVTVKGNG